MFLIELREYIHVYFNKSNQHVCYLSDSPPSSCDVGKSGFGLSDLISPYRVIINLLACKLFYWQELI